MPILQYETRILEDGSFSLPLLPEYRNRTVVISVDEGQLDDWQPDPAAVRQLFEKRIAVEITDEEIEQLKHERRMRKML